MLTELKNLEGLLEATVFPWSTPHSEQGAKATSYTLRQLQDYVIARLETLDAPLLVVVGGSTGAGKSTLVNSIFGQNLTQASALRPTTRRPTLVYNPQDEQWFTGERILPQLARVRSSSPTQDAHLSAQELTSELAMVPNADVPRGIALLDSPDIDSVVKENRELANQLLAGADLWVFVTTAARYADAAAWSLLDEAAKRNVSAAVVLNRVSPSDEALIAQDLREKMKARNLAGAPLFTIAESQLTEQGRITNERIEPLRNWLFTLAGDAAARAEVARQTLNGALLDLVARGETVVKGYGEQVAVTQTLQETAQTRLDEAAENISRASSDGTLLRGELLGRWQDVVGTGDWSRKLEGGISRLRDRIVRAITGKPEPQVQAAQVAIEDGVYQLIYDEVTAAVRDIRSDWEKIDPQMLSEYLQQGTLRSDEERSEGVARLVRDWQAGLLDLVSSEGASKKTTARILSLGVNAVGVALIIVVFANTGGLVGGEVAVAGGTAVVAQKVLEAVFGDDAVRRMTARVKADLDQRVAQFVDVDRAQLIEAVAKIGVNGAHLENLTRTYSSVEREVSEGRA